MSQKSDTKNFTAEQGIEYRFRDRKIWTMYIINEDYHSGTYLITDIHEDCCEISIHHTEDNFSKVMTEFWENTCNSRYHHYDQEYDAEVSDEVEAKMQEEKLFA